MSSEVAVAVQRNGITVVFVDDASRTIRMYVGDVDVSLRYDRETNALVVMKRTAMIGRNPRPFIPRLQYRDMMRQAHAIASRHGWK